MFLDMALRSIWRNKVRSGLTVLGIVLAIAAIVALGSISQGLNLMITEQLSQMSGFIAVGEVGSLDLTGGAMGGAMASKISEDVTRELEQIDGIKEIIPQIKGSVTGDVFVVAGMNLDEISFMGLEHVEFVEGGWPNEDELGITLGYSAAKNGGWSVDDELLIQGEKYNIVGILKEQGGAMDMGAITNLKTAEEIFGMDGYYTQVIVVPIDVADASRIANEIEETYDYLDAMSSEELLKEVTEMIDMVGLMTLSIGIIASVVASIGIINTMIMVVFERKREFGIMKALGAEKKTILSIVMSEAAVLGLIGAVIGILLGMVGTELVNQMGGFAIARVTPERIVASFIYGIMLAVLAAAYPASQAIKVDPVEAMRE